MVRLNFVELFWFDFDLDVPNDKQIRHNSHFKAELEQGRY